MCAWPKTLEPLAAHHGNIRPPESWEHNSKRHLIRIVPPIPGLWTCFTHAECTCNEIISAANRVLGEVPLPSVAGIKMMKSAARRLSERAGHFEPWTFEQVLQSFTADRRKRYQVAYDSLVRDPLDINDARISAFVKAEKINPLEKENPDPRMIQARDPRYNICIAKYLRPIEHFIYNMTDRWGYRLVAKGLNQADRASILKEKFLMFEDPVCFSIDASRWDKHVSMAVLKIEHAFYQSCLPNYPEFDRLLKWQQINQVRTSTGVKYKCFGGRMSGDINTALGNCLLMVIMVQAAMKLLGIKYSLFDDGDDCLVLVESADFSVVESRLAGIFLEFGQELKIENIARDVRSVVFCQSKVVNNGINDIFVRDWRKVLSHACCGTRHWNDPFLVRPMLGLVGVCELALNAGVPILQEFALSLIRNSRGQIASLDKMAATGLVYRVKNEYGTLEDAQKHAKERAVTLAAREAFEEAFDCPIWEQLEIEHRLKLWNITTTTATTVPDEWGLGWEDCRSDLAFIPDVF